MKNTTHEGARALVISTGRDRGALAAVRSLRQSGWLVGVGTPDGDGMLSSSAAVSARHVVPRPRLDGSAFVAGVRRAVLLGSYDVVFGGGDDWMAALATYRDKIPTRVAHPPADAVNAALNKVELSARADRVDLSAPHTVHATDQAIAQWQGPVVVKCLTHWAHGQTRPHRIEAKLFPDAVSAGPQIERIRKAGAEPILQEPIKGHLGALIGVFHDGHLDGRVQQVTSRLWPTPNGVSTRAETVAVDEGLVTRAEALLSDLGWWGLVELQFLIDDDGVHHLIDLNGRFFGSMALTNAARPGLTDLWGRLVLGESVLALPDAVPGRRYAWTAGDLRRASVERRGGRLTDILDTLRWGSQGVHSVWNLRDPGPTLHLASTRLRRAERKPRTARVVS